MKRNLLLFTALLYFLSFSLYLLIILPVKANTTITVTTTSDVIGNDGQCALREAIIAANSDTAFGDCPGGSGADTITFSPTLNTPFTLTQAGANEDSALSGDLDISESVFISGAGAGQTIIDGANSDRIFHILPGALVTLDGLTIQHGNPGVSAKGGGIAIELTGVLTLTNSSVSNNTALNGGGVYSLGRLSANDTQVTTNQGGGIHNFGGLLELTHVDIHNNFNDYGLRNEGSASLVYADGSVNGNQGGGVYNDASSATLTRLNIISNTLGSGVSNNGNSLSHLTLSQSIVMSNTATNGGGIFNGGVSAVFDVIDTRVSGNTAVVSGGGIYNYGTMNVNNSTLDHNHARSGGGIDHSGTSLHMTNDTISSNTASDNGGGIYNRGSATLTHVTLNGNIANGPDTGGNIFNDEALLTLQNNIVAKSDADGNCYYSGGFVTSSGNNLDDGNTCAFGQAGDLVNTDPLLGPLQDNGGPTWTHALLSGSPAIDQGNSAFCPATDQRGQARPPTACDIGAYEVENTADLAISVKTDPVLVGTNGVMTYTLSIINQGVNPANSVAITDLLPIEVVHVTSYLSGGGSCSYSNIVTCSLPALMSGESVTVTIVADTPAYEVVIVNEAQVTSDTPEVNLENNSATTTTAVAVIRYVYLPIVMQD